MKLRLTQAGFETYSGQMGVVMFENGLSVGDVLPIDAVRISAAIGATWEDGTAANVGEMYLNSMDVPAHVGGGINSMTPPAPLEVSNEGVLTDASASVEAAPAGQVWTEEALAKVADEKGIAGLRAIGDPLGAKGTSIVGLIAEILKKQTAPSQSE